MWYQKYRQGNITDSSRKERRIKNEGFFHIAALYVIVSSLSWEKKEIVKKIQIQQPSTMAFRINLKFKLTYVLVTV